MISPGSFQYYIHKLLIISFFLFIQFSFTPINPIFNIEDFGAKANATIINTIAINKAIHACNRQGGGTAMVPKGTFISGTVVLLSNITLHLENGAVLMCSKDTSDYLLLTNALFNEGYNRYGLIYAENATNIATTGFGEINGNNRHFCVCL